MPNIDPNNQTPDETTLLLTQLTRIGVAIDKELTLISERMSWLVISESFIFSAFTVAVANQEKAAVLDTLAYLMPLVGFLMALLVYPSLLAAHISAQRLKVERHEFELRLPEHLRARLLAPKGAHILGSLPAFVIPVMFLLVWSAIIVVFVLVPRK
jgi:hypothetical protein